MFRSSYYRLIVFTIYLQQMKLDLAVSKYQTYILGSGLYYMALQLNFHKINEISDFHYMVFLHDSCAFQ